MDNPSPTLGFSREERLKSQKLIADLFKSGQSYVAYPFRVVWMPYPEYHICDAQAQVAFSVPKRTFKKAHDRNRIKRQMREAYRLQKLAWHETLAQHNVNAAIMLTFIGKEPVPYAEMQDGIRKMIKKFGRS